MTGGKRTGESCPLSLEDMFSPLVLFFNVKGEIKQSQCNFKKKNPSF